VDIKAERKLKNPVPLTVLKADKRFADMDLVRLGRLSVQTVKPKEWELVMKLAGEK
jgi:predicted RNA-binding protein with PUA-like domain